MGGIFKLRMHYYLTPGREFLTTRDAKRTKAQLEAGENSIWKPDFNKGQMLSSVLLLEELNLLQLLTPGEQLRSSDEAMQEFKALALKHRYVIKNYLHVTISEKLTSIVIAQKLLDKIDLRLSFIGRLGPRGKRECVYQFVPPDDERDAIFDSWLSRDEVLNRESVSVTNNIHIQTQVSDIHDISQTFNEAAKGWKGLKLKLRQGLESAGQFYQQLVSQLGTACGFEEQLPTPSVVDNFRTANPSFICKLKITIFSGENFYCFDLERIEVEFAPHQIIYLQADFRKIKKQIWC
ncbi:MAG: hypothetical protein ACYTXI_18700 [Nostoc sp.]